MADGDAPMSMLDDLMAGREKAFLERFFERLRLPNVDGDGVTRVAFGAGENDAHALLRDLGDGLGLSSSIDPAGNLALTLDSETPGPTVVLGSHLDSVPQGGNFDGAAGVAAALLSVARIARSGEKPALPLEILAMRCEESAWFNRAYVGSLALFGALSERDLERPHRYSGASLAECLAEAGADVARIRAGERLRDPQAIRAYFEVHIEQGPVMLTREMAVAPVTGIRGNRRYPANRIVGEAGHSGAVPRWLRHDTVFAFAELINALDEHWRVLQERGIDLVVTSGVVQTDPAEHGMTRIPGDLSFSLEVRSQSDATLDAFDGLVRAECEAIGARRGVRFELDDVVFSAPATVDPALQKALLDAARSQGIETEPIASGAGHDAVVFAGAGVPVAMLFVRNEGGSHNPKERMDIDDLLVAVDVLHRTLTDHAFTEPA